MITTQDQALAALAQLLIREIFAESKANGYCVKTLRQILKLRKQDASEREEQENVLSTYMHALGMLPLFDDDSEGE